SLEAGRREHRDLSEIGLRRQPGARIDEVVEAVAPAPAGGAARRGAELTKEHGRRPEPDRPALAVRPRAAGPEVPGEVGERVPPDPFNRSVGEPALRDPSKAARRSLAQPRSLWSPVEHLRTRPRHAALPGR